MMKFLKTIRFDTSDDHVYEVPAGPDEWAVTGAFAFAGMTEDDLTGKIRQAFSNAFLGLETFGFSTFASVAEITGEELARLEARLAKHFVERYGAPDEDAALPAAREETRFVLDLCGEPLINTIFTVRRGFDEAGEIREEFRTIQAPSKERLHTRIWDVVEDDG